MRRLVSIVLVICCAAPLAHAQQTLIDAQTEAMSAAVIGLWTAEIGTARVRLRLSETDTYQLGSSRGTYEIRGSTLALTNTDGDRVGYNAAFTGRDILTLSGADLTQPLRFTRVRETTGAFSSFIQFTAPEIRQRALSIALIILIAIASRLILGLVKMASGVLIYSERGVLRHFYSENKNRRRTFHSLVLDLLKYIVYFTAFGFILSELGINYTTYLASLSVIGLAVGFGSQGLVQDIVTGFFLIFEGQFDVGDMVEISGQIGLVQNMGLRMTKIQNYAGQVVFVPNRNIAIASRYVRGGLEGYLDVSIQSAEDLPRVQQFALETAGELSEQFDEIFLSTPHTEGAVELKTNEVFLRLHFSVWPGQTWVIDQQLIPRLRERLARESIPIPGDRIIAFYHVRQREPARHRLSSRIGHVRWSTRRRRRKTQLDQETGHAGSGQERADDHEPSGKDDRPPVTPGDGGS